MDFFRSVNFKRIVIILLVFLAAVLLSKCNAQNKKPVAINDTFTNEGTKPIQMFTDSGTYWYHPKKKSQNVLSNDRDPNGDQMIVTMFNGHSFKGQDSVFIETIGTFYLNEKGEFRYRLEPAFSGTVELSYNVNDNKAGASKRAYIIFVIHKQW